MPNDLKWRCIGWLVPIHSDVCQENTLKAAFMKLFQDVSPHGPLAKKGEVGKMPQLFMIRIRTPLKIRAAIG